MNGSIPGRFAKLASLQLLDWESRIRLDGIGQRSCVRFGQNYRSDANQIINKPELLGRCPNPFQGPYNAAANLHPTLKPSVLKVVVLLVQLAT